MNGFEEKPDGHDSGISVRWELASGETGQAGVLGLSRHVVTFQVFGDLAAVRASESLVGFVITSGKRVMYSGRAVVSKLINTGLSLVCEATLDESCFAPGTVYPGCGLSGLRDSFAEFLSEMGPVSRIRSEFKLTVAEMQTSLLNLRTWLDQVELGIAGNPPSDRQKLEGEVLAGLPRGVFQMLEGMFERFEADCSGIEESMRPAYGYYVKRHLHPLVLCAPFMRRTFLKPLGYAGDYEMVSMMMRNPYEGDSLFARMLNSYFLSTAPVIAHRNRIATLVKILHDEARRAHFGKRPLRIFDLGCGPAQEVQEFLKSCDASDRAHFTLVDFNSETVQFVRKALDLVKTGAGRQTSIDVVQKSTTQLLKEATKRSHHPVPGSYDLVYCAGLFDYLPDPVCRRLISVLFAMVAPGGRFVFTNVESNNPSRNWMEYSVDWHLIYRDHKMLRELCSEGLQFSEHSIYTESSGVNIFMEIRKPEYE